MEKLDTKLVKLFKALYKAEKSSKPSIHITKDSWGTGVWQIYDPNLKVPPEFQSVYRTDKHLKDVTFDFLLGDEVETLIPINKVVEEQLEKETLILLKASEEDMTYVNPGLYYNLSKLVRFIYPNQDIKIYIYPGIKSLGQRYFLFMIVYKAQDKVIAVLMGRVK